MCRSMRMPSLGKTVKAETCSRSFMSAAPSASGKYGGSGVVMPNRLVTSTTGLMPTFSASFTAGKVGGAGRGGGGGGGASKFFLLFPRGERGGAPAGGERQNTNAGEAGRGAFPSR